MKSPTRKISSFLALLLCAELIVAPQLLRANEEAIVPPCEEVGVAGSLQFLHYINTEQSIDAYALVTLAIDLPEKSGDPIHPAQFQSLTLGEDTLTCLANDSTGENELAQQTYGCPMADHLSTGTQSVRVTYTHDTGSCYLEDMINTDPNKAKLQSYEPDFNIKECMQQINPLALVFTGGLPVLFCIFPQIIENIEGLKTDTINPNITDSSGTPISGGMDNDGIPFFSDSCADIYDPAQSDSNQDGVGDACDSDGDGIHNNVDNCPELANATQKNTDMDSEGDVCDSDDDNDGIPDAEDNCPLHVNAAQHDSDGDHIGNVCDTDLDGDGILNVNDNCPELFNQSQSDSDGDGIGDPCDSILNENTLALCSPTEILVGSTTNCQLPSEADSDSDGVLDIHDICPNDPLNQCAQPSVGTQKNISEPAAGGGGCTLLP